MSIHEKIYIDKTQIPYIINETTIAVITADEIQAAIDITEGGGGTLGKYLYFEIDNPDLEAGESLFIEYGGYTFRTQCPPNGYQSYMYCVDIVVSDNSDSFVVPEGQMMLFIKRGFNKNGEEDETKCRVSCNLDQSNVTDMVIQHKTIKSMDNLLLGEDVTVINSLSMGRANNTAIGTNSVALGEHAEASTGYAIALGNDVHAQGGASVSLGQQNISSGYASFTSGYGNIASANYSTAEGRYNKATGAYTHVEGYKNEASASSAHAEGTGSQAKGDQSHAEGQYTIAASTNQHVQGKFNIKDTENKYAHIVGNGTKNSARSNAHTLDWDGNAWFQGNVSIDGTPTNDNDLVTKKYVDHDLVINSLDNGEWFRISKDNADLISTGSASFTVPDNLDLPTNYCDDTKLMVEFKGKRENFVASQYSMTQGKMLQCLLLIDNSICLGIMMQNSHPSDGTEDGAFDDFTIEVMFMNPNTFETIVPPQGLLTEDIVLVKSYQYFNDNFTRNNIAFANSLANLNSEARGINSIAVGGSCMATGNMSAAFGKTADASGYVSFAAGDGDATGDFSHAVNNGHASGEYSHAENKAYATGESSHAENNGNAHGLYSHAEGYATVAYGENQHVQGRLNIADNENKYAHIVGNGTKGAGWSDPDTRSNAHTLDWDGNAWFQGNVSVDGTPTNDNDLTTKKYVDDSINNIIKQEEVSAMLNEVFGTAEE